MSHIRSPRRSKKVNWHQKPPKAENESEGMERLTHYTRPEFQGSKRLYRPWNWGTLWIWHTAMVSHPLA